MKKLLYAFVAVLVVSIVVSSCSKSDVKSASTNDLSISLTQSQEFSEYVTATNNIVSNIQFAAINRNDLQKAAALFASKGQYTKEQFTEVLNKLHIDANAYFKQRTIMSDALKSFQSKHNLSNEQNAVLWKYVIEKNSTMFLPSNTSNILGIGQFINCIQDAGTTFATTTAICLALREIPIIGQQLFESCEKEAVTGLIDDLLSCAGL